MTTRYDSEKLHHDLVLFGNKTGYKKTKELFAATTRLLEAIYNTDMEKLSDKCRYFVVQVTSIIQHGFASGIAAEMKKQGIDRRGLDESCGDQLTIHFIMAFVAWINKFDEILKDTLYNKVTGITGTVLKYIIMCAWIPVMCVMTAELMTPRAATIAGRPDISITDYNDYVLFDLAPYDLNTAAQFDTLRMDTPYNPITQDISDSTFGSTHRETNNGGYVFQKNWRFYTMPKHALSTGIYDMGMMGDSKYITTLSTYAQDSSDIVTKIFHKNLRRFLIDEIEYAIYRRYESVSRFSLRPGTCNLDQMRYSLKKFEDAQLDYFDNTGNVLKRINNDLAVSPHEYKITAGINNCDHMLFDQGLVEAFNSYTGYIDIYREVINDILVSIPEPGDIYESTLRKQLTDTYGPIVNAPEYGPSNGEVIQTYSEYFWNSVEHLMNTETEQLI